MYYQQKGGRRGAKGQNQYDKKQGGPKGQS